MAKPKKYYVDDVKLKEELAKSYEQNKLTVEAINMFLKMVDGATKRFTYKFEEDREDCMQSAMEQILTKWKKFDMERDKPFAYFASMIHCAFSCHYKTAIQTKGFKGIDGDDVEIEKIDKEGNKITRIKKIKHFPQTVSISDELNDII